MLGLKLATDPRWAELVDQDIGAILSDHAWCEQKAASNAISMIVRYPELSALVTELTRIAQEELDHFGQVVAHIHERGWVLGPERKALLLGNAAAQHPQASQLLALAQWIGEHTGASVGYLGEAANTVGAQLLGVLPGAGGLHAGQMLSQGMKALLLLNVEPELDAADAPAARTALQRSGLVVALTAFKDAVVENADVLLPIAPFTETAGSFVNAEGRLQAFTGVVPPLGDTRPAWKVLRVLGNLLGLSGFEQDNAEQVRTEAIGDPSALLRAFPSTVGGAWWAFLKQNYGIRYDLSSAGNLQLDADPGLGVRVAQKKG